MISIKRLFPFILAISFFHSIPTFAQEYENKLQNQPIIVASIPKQKELSAIQEHKPLDKVIDDIDLYYEFEIKRNFDKPFLTSGYVEQTNSVVGNYLKDLNSRLGVYNTLNEPDHCRIYECETNYSGLRNTLKNEAVKTFVKDFKLLDDIKYKYKNFNNNYFTTFVSDKGFSYGKKNIRFKKDEKAVSLNFSPTIVNEKPAMIMVAKKDIFNISAKYSSDELNVGSQLPPIWDKVNSHIGYTQNDYDNKAIFSISGNFEGEKLYNKIKGLFTSK